MASKTAGLSASWSDVWLLDGVRTPFVDYNGGLAATCSVTRPRQHPSAAPSKSCCPNDIALSEAEARPLPQSSEEEKPMDTFFVRKQVVIGAVMFGCLELAVMLFQALGR